MDTELPIVTLRRRSDNDPVGATFGDLTAPGGFECVTVERPATGDHPRVNAGMYCVSKFNSPAHGLCYKLEDRDGRTFIEIHSANLWQQLLGCIALGRAVMNIEIDWEGQHYNEMGVSSSKDAVGAFWNHMGGLDFMLVITDG